MTKRVARNLALLAVLAALFAMAGCSCKEYEEQIMQLDAQIAELQQQIADEELSRLADTAPDEATGQAEGASAAAVAEWPDLHTTTTFLSFSFCSSVSGLASREGSTFFALTMWPRLKSATGETSTITVSGSFIHRTA